MASANAETLLHRKRPWRERTRRLSCRLFCCSCLPCEERDSLREQEMKINGGPQHPHLDQRGSGEKEAIQITVEDLGIVNTSFSLLDEDPLTSRNSMARSASSVSVCPRALKKKGLKPLSSLPIQLQSEPAVASTSGEDDEEDEEDPLLYDSGTDSTPASGSLLTPPVINLIPPSPSDVVDDDQFFDINSEESVAHTSGCDGSFAAGDQESYEEKMESVEAEEPNEGLPVDENKVGLDNPAEPEEGPSGRFEEEGESVPTKEETKTRILRSAYQVAPLPEYPQRRSINTGINLLSFTEHNLDDPSNRDVSCSDALKAELRPHAANMDTVTHRRRPITRSCSLEDTITRSATFHAFTHTTEKDEEGSPRQRRRTIASVLPQSKDQNGNFPEKDVDRQVAKCLRELNTEEVCQWFTNIGLQKCLPCIKDAKLCGADIASVDVNTLDILHVTSLEDREQLLSAIYNELHPPSTITQRLDSLLESSGPNNVETFTATLVSMSKSTSAPHVSCLSMNRRSLKLRNNSQNYMVQKNSQLIEITINASERIVHLRTPKETAVGKIMDSCIKMLGVTEDKSLFALKEKQGSSEELPPDQQIGSLLTSTSENRQLELHLCKMEKPTAASPNSPEVGNSNGNGNTNKNIQGNQLAKEERIRELNQQVDSLQNVIFQVQELHHGLVAFCSELKNMDGDVNVDRLGSVELKQRLESLRSKLNDKRQSLQNLRDNINNSAALKKKQLEVRLLEKMKLNCQVFKEEISMVHLNRQVAHLQNALQESKEKTRKKSVAIGSLSQLVSQQSPAMLLLVQENQGSDGRYGFACGYREGSGLVVDKVDNTHLCVDDRLVEVNGVPVVNFTQEELTDLLLQGPSAQIVVLRQPPPTLTCQPHLVPPDPMQTVCPESDVVAMETPPRRKVMAI
ncbi:uncharacterized protein LOC117775875 isoform X1 [Hippoglossus hippoglossus]|uniref:uncharacterized protein LOC117775875 isoform X1 n=1 Tax=Hippoglossus hippoglossus TaxID=8267 RepID=UPI00148DF453|nr:uncharacterized protein LOC117775875 isoform X1 [Hippoglossus hippoglossus]